MNKVMLLAGMALVALTGCTSYYTDQAAQAQVAAVPSAGPEYRTEWKIADQRVKADGNAKSWFGIFTSGDSKFAELPGLNVSFFGTSHAIYRAKASATYTACEQAKADALLGASYRYCVTNYLFFSTVKCEVLGYPATITGLEPRENKLVLIRNDQKIVRLKPWETVEAPKGVNAPSSGNAPADGEASILDVLPF